MHYKTACITPVQKVKVEPEGISQVASTVLVCQYFRLHVIAAAHLACHHGLMALLVTMSLDLTIQLVKF